MESWLTKPRVLLGLCGVLLMAALNRQDPMVYGMFLFLAVVSFLGFVLPWLSLRSMRLRLESSGAAEVVEAVPSSLQIWIERSLPWPAFMVEVETEWAWAGQRTVLRQTLPVVRASAASRLADVVRFACRGHYRLVAVRLSSGFPLGLMRAQHTMTPADIHQVVLPQPQNVHWPLPWDVTEDPLGEHTTRKMGQSFELGMLRPYQPGEPVGRVSWRASARAGALVIQQFQHSGSIRLRMAVEAPSAPALGDANSAGEQAVRLALGACEAALAHGVQLFAYLDSALPPMQDRAAVVRALAGLRPSDPGSSGLADSIARLAKDVSPGEQVAVVVSGVGSASGLLAALAPLQGLHCAVVVCVALGRQHTPSQWTDAQVLQQTLQHASFAAVLEAP